MLASSTFAQRSQDWVEENWQRVSGEVDNFQNQFPSSENRAVQPINYNRTGSGNGFVRQADHQAQTQPVQPSMDGVSDVLDTEQPPSDKNTSLSTAQWADDLQGQLKKVDWPKVLSSLAIVVGCYLGFVWLMRKANPKRNGGLPSEVFELVGSKRMNSKQTLQLVRLGSKLLLLVNGEEGTQSIAEITDPNEVEYLTSVCNRRPTTRPRAAARPSQNVAAPASGTGFRSAMDRASREGDTTEAAMDKVIRKLTEMAGKATRTDYEA